MSTALITGTPHSYPLYAEVRGEITRGLAGGEWKPGELIPSEADLAKRFGVSKGTIRHALDELVSERILVRRQGRGTFVATHSRDRTLYHFFHLIGRDGARVLPDTKLLSYRVLRGSDEACDTLGIERQSKLVGVRNLVTLGGEPVFIDEILIPQASVPGLTESMYASRESTIYALYQSRFNINVIRISERLGAGPAPAQHAKLLGIRANAPVLVIDRVAYTYHDKPVELRKSWVNTGAYVYRSDLRKELTLNRNSLREMP
ncbi:MAG TPA: GntR family transcriptional regulator [Burkholderiales bacterium]|nr:GntR family transcriptional regulator [Burkholderiales bacterium]